MPYEAYIGYLKDDSHETKAEVINQEPFVLEVRDLDTFERLVVKALVAEPPNSVEGGDQLWVLDWVEKKLEDPWSIQVLKELEEDALEDSRSDISQADLDAPAQEAQKLGGRGYRGSQTPQMMGQEEARKYYENVVGKKK